MVSNWRSTDLRPFLGCVLVFSLTLTFLIVCVLIREVHSLRDVRNPFNSEKFRGHINDLLYGQDFRHREKDRGHINDLLYRQGLSHVAFHTMAMKNHLASLVRHTNNIAIVGVEWGGEARALAKRGYRVHCFEPHVVFYKELSANASRNPNMVLYNIAVGPKEGELQLSYQGFKDVVRMAPLHKYISTELDVLSLDIQGNEYDALLGAQGIRVRSMWIEILSCNPKVGKVFRLLDKEYVIFDFVPWGIPKKGRALRSSLADLDQFKWTKRPSEFDAYLKSLCNLRTQFKWIQSDVVAIRRDILTPKMLEALASISNDLYVSVVEKARSRKHSNTRRTKH